MKIVADKRIPGFAEGINALLPDAEFIMKEGSEITAADVRDADALIVRTRTRCDASLLRGSRVRLIGSATIGTDHIDLPWCKEAGISVVNAPGCNAPAVMQYVASTLHAAGFDPRRHTLGVVGKGHIGSLVTELYKKEGTRVVVCDPPRAEAGLTDEDYLPLEDLLEVSDAVTLHVPYTTSGPHPTGRMLSGPLPENLQIIVNASRGPVVDTALVSTNRKWIIDTWPFEEFPADFNAEERRRLIDSAFIATPHIAGYSVEGKGRATRAMLAALARFAAAETMETAGRGGETYAIPDLRTVIDSFDPRPLSEALKTSPDAFEALRGAHLRPEPSQHQQP